MIKNRRVKNLKKQPKYNSMNIHQTDLLTMKSQSIK